MLIVNETTGRLEVENLCSIAKDIRDKLGCSFLESKNIAIKSALEKELSDVRFVSNADTSFAVRHLTRIIEFIVQEKFV